MNTCSMLQAGRVVSAFTCMFILAQPTALAQGAPVPTEVDQLEAALIAVPEASTLRAWHNLLSSEPHVAGTEADWRTINRLLLVMDAMGLEIRLHEFEPLLAEPVRASLEILAPEPVALDLKERPVWNDPFTNHPDLTIGWNAYSASGTVEGEVVYVNRGTREDFAWLKEQGVDLTGKIAIARYGGNYRGYKATYAQEAGTIGLIIFSDPADGGGDGFTRPVYPDGGWANDSYIQRGSILNLPYPGDPLTPFVPAHAEVPRLPIDEVDLPRIPVQPIGASAASEILVRMTGDASPESWRGDLPVDYRLTGGADLRVRLSVEQRLSQKKTGNALGIIRGSEFPDEFIVIGAHHDAWSFGAGDPNSGTIVVLETARAFTEAARQGFRPRRTLIFAHWGAEEFGIIGSTEWCEANADDLRANAVAYINLDMASMGPNFGASAFPSLRPVIESATKRIPQARSEAGQMIFDAWSRVNEQGARTVRFGDLGGGSDHVGFLCHLGVPSAGISAGGSPGVSYHSNYETLQWYRQTVGDDYEPALMLSRVVSAIAARLAHEPILPLDQRAVADDLSMKIASLAEWANELDAPFDAAALNTAVDAYRDAASGLGARLDAAPVLSKGDLATLNARLRAFDRIWLHEEGLPGRPWWRNLYAASDPYSGYAAWMLPLLREAIESGEAETINHTIALYEDVLERLSNALRETTETLPPVAVDQ